MQHHWIRSCAINIRPSQLALPALALLLLCGCASLTTTTIKRTGTIRNPTVTEKAETTRIRASQLPSAENPNLEIVVIRQITEEEAFQRKYIEEEVRKIADRLALWFSGALAAGVGYREYQRGRVVLGRYLMGLGLLVPLGWEVLWRGTKVGEQWKQESRVLPSRTVPAPGVPLAVTAGDSTWSDTTGGAGKVGVDISGFADLATPGQPLEIEVTLQEDTTRTAVFSIPPDVVALYRTPPPARAPEIEVVKVEPPAGPVVDQKDTPTLAIIDFEGLGISVQETRVLTNRLGTHMVQLGAYKVIERGQMQQVLAEQDFQLTGCTSNECAMEIGQLLGVQQMLAGSFGKFGTIYTIDMRIIDVSTGGILRTTSYDVQGEAERLLTEGLAEAARRIAGVD